MNILKNISIEKLIYGGYGLAKYGGKTLMIEYGLPQEVVDVEVLQEKKNYIIGRVRKVLKASEARRDAPCPYYEICGGCQLQHMEYAEQLRAKEDILLETLERIGKIKVNKIEKSLFAEEFGYRIKAQFKANDGLLGFYERRSHNIVNIDKCLLLHPSINELIPSLKELSKKLRVIEEIEAIYSPTEGEFLLRLFSQEEIGKEKLRKIMENYLPKAVVGVGVYKDRKLYSLGRDFLFLQIGPYTYRLSMDSFIQVNYMLWERFIESAMPEEKVEKALELHCGIGFFSLFLAKKSDFLLAYDSNGRAIKDAEYNAKVNSVSNITFGNERSSIALKRHAGEVIDLIFLDPPRSGLSEGEAQLILQNKPKHIIYVSCEPTTFARDLKVLAKGGYTLESLRMVDNFPNTYHIEAIAHFVF